MAKARTRAKKRPVTRPAKARHPWRPVGRTTRKELKQLRKKLADHIKKEPDKYVAWSALQRRGYATRQTVKKEVKTGLDQRQQEEKTKVEAQSNRSRLRIWGGVLAFAIVFSIAMLFITAVSGLLLRAAAATAFALLAALLIFLFLSSIS